MKEMKKAWYMSLTIWGAVGWAVVVLLEGLTIEWPITSTIAKGLATLLTIVGIRRLKVFNK